MQVLFRKFQYFSSVGVIDVVFPTGHSAMIKMCSQISLHSANKNTNIHIIFEFSSYFWGADPRIFLHLPDCTVSSSLCNLPWASSSLSIFVRFCSTMSINNPLYCRASSGDISDRLALWLCGLTIISRTYFNVPVFFGPIFHWTTHCGDMCFLLFL